MAKHLLSVDASPAVSPPPQKKKKQKKAKKDGKETSIASDTKSVQTNGGKHKGKSDRLKGNSDNRDYVESPELSTLPQSTVDEFLATDSVNVTDPSGKPALRPILSFTHLPPVSNGLYGSLEGFSKPTPIQSTTWPLLFAGRDVIGVAQTGSGKTLAFGIPCLQQVAMRKKSRSSITAAIITPTRELAIQIYDHLTKCASAIGVSIACVYGGAPKDEQRQAIKKASVVVATPGRLKDLLAEKSVELKKIRYLVLDEADRMLDKGFEQDIRDIVAATSSSKKRQTVMFTATWPMAVRDLAASFTTDAVNVAIGETSNELRANTSIKQVVEVLQPQEKESRLLGLLRKYQSGKNSNDRILVFCLYKKEATRIERFIHSRGFNVAGIHGDMNQTERIKSLNAFKNGSVSLLVATDVAARGLDIPAVKLVLNVTFPLTVEDYVHRIGRTGRAGAEGLAITLFTDHDKAQSGAYVVVVQPNHHKSYLTIF